LLIVRFLTRFWLTDKIRSEFDKKLTSNFRIFSAYGPGLRKQILRDISHQAIKNKQISLFGTGMETRDFIFIRDVAYSVQLVLEQGVLEYAKWVKTL
jgi:nucleoside-diphosphate-sugar epimerase